MLVYEILIYIYYIYIFFYFELRSDPNSIFLPAEPDPRTKFRILSPDFDTKNIIQTAKMSFNAIL